MGLTAIWVGSWAWTQTRVSTYFTKELIPSESAKPRNPRNLFRRAHTRVFLFHCSSCLLLLHTCFQFVFVPGRRRLRQRRWLGRELSDCFGAYARTLLPLLLLLLGSLGSLGSLALGGALGLVVGGGLAG